MHIGYLVYIKRFLFQNHKQFKFFSHKVSQIRESTFRMLLLFYMPWTHHNWSLLCKNVIVNFCLILVGLKLIAWS